MIDFSPSLPSRSGTGQLDHEAFQKGVLTLTLTTRAFAHFGPTREFEVSSQQQQMASHLFQIHCDGRE